MKLKYVFVILTSVFLIFSLSQLLNIPPYAEDVFPLYKSGYFIELENGFKIIKDSFIGIKTLGEPAMAWIFLADIKTGNNILAKIYDNKGYQVFAPNKKSARPDKQIEDLINSYKSKIYSEIKNGRYFSIIPLYNEGKCNFCHKIKNNKKIIGAMSFERSFSSKIYYSAERKIIFLFISIVLGLILYIILKWVPGKNIKELFDKS